MSILVHVKRIETIGGKNPCMVMYPLYTVKAHQPPSPQVSLWMDKEWLMRRQREISIDILFVSEMW